jgi:hypothetical protein
MRQPSRIAIGGTQLEDKVLALRIAEISEPAQYDLRTARRVWRMVVLATQTPLTMTLPAPQPVRMQAGLEQGAHEGVDRRDAGCRRFRGHGFRRTSIYS